MKCNEGSSGFHGFPEELEPKDCDAGVVNCAKITGSKYLRLLTKSSIICYHAAINAESVRAWSCGLKTEQSNCVSGIPDGMLDVGETVDGALTCFCTGDLCNGEHFCDGCVAGSGVGMIAASILTTLVMAIMI